LERKLQIVLPWRPRLSAAIWTMLPGVLLFGGVFAAWLSVPAVMTPATRPAWVMAHYLLTYPCVQWAYLFCSPCMRWLPKTSSWALMLVSGLALGLWACLLKCAIRSKSHFADVFNLWIFEVPNILFAMESLRLTFTVLCKEALEIEADQLSFESVRQARCSWPQDEERIYAQIQAIEDTIDDAIRTLKLVGRYDSAVLSNLRRGLSVNQTRQGVSTLRLGIVCTYLGLIPLSSMGRFMRELHMGQLEGLATGLLTCLMAISALAFTHTAGDHATFFVDALFWSSTCAWIGGSHAKDWVPLVPEIARDRLSLGVTCTCFLCVLFACQLFYRGRLSCAVRIGSAKRPAKSLG